MPSKVGSFRSRTVSVRRQYRANSICEIKLLLTEEDGTENNADRQQYTLPGRRVVALEVQRDDTLNSKGCAVCGTAECGLPAKNLQMGEQMIKPGHKIKRTQSQPVK